MKILYAVQATGNGHISRATQLLPYLKEYGNVDIFLSGANCQLAADLPVKYRSKGLGLFYNRGGGLDYVKMMQQANIPRIAKEVRALPVEKYDVVINDFESITALACKYKNIASVQFGHQAAFQSPLVPRPVNKKWMGEFLLKHYAVCEKYIGLHFKKYDDFIFEPIIKKEILTARPKNKGHITVYLSAYNNSFLLKHLGGMKKLRFEVFSKEVSQVTYAGNITFFPVNQQLFNESMIHAHGVITGAGFETPAEVLQLQKKLMVIPIKGQYEQQCNAAALGTLGIKVLTTIDKDFVFHCNEWLQQPQPDIYFNHNIPSTLNYLFNHYPYRGESLDMLYPQLTFN